MLSPEGLRRLLSPATALDEARSLLLNVEFHNSAAAVRRLQSFSPPATFPTNLTEELIMRLLATIPDSPDPDLSLINFERFIQSSQDPASTWTFLAENPRAVEILLRLFVVSQHLTETLVRHPEYLPELTQHKRLADLKSREDFLQECLDLSSGPSSVQSRLDAVRRAHSREILRIAACDVFSLLDLKSVTLQISLLADAVIHTMLQILAESMNQSLQGIVVLAMGKLGGEELNYSSDIDLIFLTEGEPGNRVLLARKLIRELQETTDQGFCYRVDMRLRPWGRSGELVNSLETHLTYLHQHAQPWELQAMLKARAVAGDLQLGRRFLRSAESAIYAPSPSERKRCVREAKTRIEDQLHREGRLWGEVKLGPGSIRDIEFIVQALQWVHSQDITYLRARGTLDALVRLADCDVLHADEYRVLTDGYIFLRTVEHVLQLVRNTQTHAIPTDRHEINYLARRLDFRDANHFLEQFEHRRKSIRAVFDKHLGTSDSERTAVPVANVPNLVPAKDLVVAYHEVFTPDEIQSHRKLFQYISETQPVSVVATPISSSDWRVTVLGIDQAGDLSMICGLLFVYGFDIVAGDIFTNCHPELALANDKTSSDHRARGRDFVNLFHVHSDFSTLPETWSRYGRELAELKNLAFVKGTGEAQGRLAHRVAEALEGSSWPLQQLLPVEIEIDNQNFSQATLLSIRGDDTQGFLYELTNGLALCGLNVERMSIRSEGSRVRDTLLVTDANKGGRLDDPRRQQEVRAAVVLIKHFTHLLPQASNAQAALSHFRQFVRDLFEQPNWWDRLASLERPEVLGALAQVLGVSDFLWEDFLRVQHQEFLPLLSDVAALERAKPRQQLKAELQQIIQSSPDTETRFARLNQFKDREMFRVDMRHILGRVHEFGEFSSELTDIAETVIHQAFLLAQNHVVARYGSPQLANAAPCRWSVLGLGKFGGRELGFASDLELLIVYEEDGQTDHTTPSANSLYFQKLVERFSQSLRSAREGVFHIDLRLRPYGKAGGLAVTRQTFEQYFRHDGPAWPYERQALVKLRPVAGDEEFGNEMVALRDRLIFRGEPFDYAAIRAMRERQVRQLVQPGTYQAKLSPGGLVDIEYLVQSLQISQGHRHPALRDPNTLAAIEALATHGILDPEAAKRLQLAYIFERKLIDALRMVRGNAADLNVPAMETPEFEFLAKRLGYGSQVVSLAQEIENHAQQVLEIVRLFEVAVKP